MSHLRFSFLSGFFLSKKFFSLFAWCSTFQFHFLWSLANHSFALALRLLFEQCKSEKGHKDIWPRNRQTKPKFSHKIIVLNSNFHHCKANFRLDSNLQKFGISWFPTSFVRTKFEAPFVSTSGRKKRIISPIFYEAFVLMKTLLRAARLWPMFKKTLYRTLKQANPKPAHPAA